MFCIDSKETSVKEHCVSNATRIISKTKKVSWEYSKIKYVTRCDKEFQIILLHKCTAFMHLINLTASLLHCNAVSEATNIATLRERESHLIVSKV
jgi:hypothetical protein